MSKRFIAIVFLFIVFRISAQKNIYAPTLVSPINASIDQPADVLLLWNGVSNAFFYKLQIDTIEPQSDFKWMKIINSNFYNIQYVTEDWTTSYFKANLKNGALVWCKDSCAAYKLLQNIDTLTRPRPTLNNTLNTKCVVPAGLNCKALATNIKYKFGKKYYWRVKSFGINLETGLVNDSSVWSNVNTFSVIDKVLLNSPLDSAQTLPIPVTIKWKAISGVSSYDYEVDVTPFFNSKYVIHETVTTPVGNPAIEAILKNLLTGTTYYWRVRAGNYLLKQDLINDKDSLVLVQSGWSEIRMFSTILNITDAPELTTPANNSTNLSPKVAFRWNSLQNATSYAYQISESPNFINPITDTIPQTFKTLYGFLFNHKYYWRVKGIGNANTSSWSEIYNFTILNQPIGITPIDGAINQNIANLKFSVDPTLVGIDEFEFQVDTVATFDSKRKQIKITTGGELNTTFLALKPSTLYYWRVLGRLSVAIKDTSDWSQTYSFTTSDGHLAAPVLNVPIDNAINQTIQTRLNWSAVSGATIYVTQIDTSINFAKPIINNSSSSVIFDVNGKISYGKTYYWRVKAFKAKTDSSQWSKIFSFSTVNIFSQIPTLYSPEMGAVDQMPNVSLLWRQTSDATKYVYQLDLNGDFITPIKSDTINDFKKTLINLTFGQLYYWRVKSVRNNSYSDWSNINTFTVIAAPSLIEPQNNYSEASIQKMIVRWNTITGITGYEVQLDKTDLFENPITNKPTATESILIYNKLNFSTTYFWRVRAIHLKDTSAWSEVRQFSTLRKVTILSPVNNSIDLVSQIELKFIPVAGATEYYFQLDTTTVLPPFTNIHKLDSTYGLTDYKVNNLFFGKTYFLRVRAKKNNDTITEWSDTISFKIINKLSLLTPANNLTEQMPDVKLGWQNINGVLSYNYQIDINSQFKPNSSTLININTVKNFLIPDTLKFGTKYYWRVLAQNENSKSAFSDTWSFTTIDTVKIISPVDGFITGDSKNVLFKWSKLTGIKNYELQLSFNDNQFLSPTSYTIASTVSSYTVKNLKKGIWWWRFRAKTNNDISQWTNPRLYELTVGIEDINNVMSNIDIYPVPCKDKCFIKFDNVKSDDIYNIELLNLLGQSIFNISLEHNNSSFVKEIELNNVESGIYFIRIFSGNKSVTKKIVKDK